MTNVNKTKNSLGTKPTMAIPTSKAKKRDNGTGRLNRKASNAYTITTVAMYMPHRVGELSPRILTGMVNKHY